jgi:uncharacterized iron-regulated membrane protein
MMHRFKKPWTARRLHLWAAIILALPFMVMAISGILIAMRSVGHVQVPMSWMSAETVPERLPFMAYLEAADGSVWIGNAAGLTQVRPGQTEIIEAFSGQEVVGLAQLGDQPWPIVGTRMAVWVRQADGQWTAVKRGRVRQLLRLSDGRVLAIAGGRGEMADGKPWVTADGVNWSIHRTAMIANRQLPPLDNPQVALHQLMREVHSGAYLMGKGPGEIAWSNLMGWILIGLCLTGLWMWIKRETHRSEERRRQRDSGGVA